MSVHMNLGSHNPDLSRNHKVLDEAFALVERVSTDVSTERAAFTTKPKELPCHGANQAHDAGVESFSGQFEGEEQ